VQYLSAKYGITPEQIAHNQAVHPRARRRGGLRLRPATRVWNTFDAHRLLCWAEGPARRRAARAQARAAAGLPRRGPQPQRPRGAARPGAAGRAGRRSARQILAGDAYAAEVREREQFWQQAGINSVPAVVIDRQHLISGGQPPEVFEQALRRIAAGTGLSGGLNRWRATSRSRPASTASKRCCRAPRLAGGEPS
jgi:predicted DsbA family dithiol-disulfide isomerase